MASGYDSHRSPIRRTGFPYPELRARSGISLLAAARILWRVSHLATNRDRTSIPVRDEERELPTRTMTAAFGPKRGPFRLGSLFLFRNNETKDGKIT